MRSRQFGTRHSPICPVLSLGEIHSPSGAEAYAAASVWLADLLPLWEAYLHYGGFPAAVAAAKAAQPVPRWFVNTLFDVVHKDAFASSNLDETQTAQLVERVWASVATPLNQSSIGANIGMHHDVVGRHLDSLRDAYLLWSVQQLDHEWIGLPRAMDKVYPVDPLIGRLAHLRSSSRSDLDLTVLAESQIGVASRRCPARTGISASNPGGVDAAEALVTKYAADWPAWGHRKIHGLLRAAGNRLSMSSVERAMRRRGLLQPIDYQGERRAPQHFLYCGSRRTSTPRYVPAATR